MSSEEMSEPVAYVVVGSYSYYCRTVQPWQSALGFDAEPIGSAPRVWGGEAVPCYAEPWTAHDVFFAPFEVAFYALGWALWLALVLGAAAAVLCGVFWIGRSLAAWVARQ